MAKKKRKRIASRGSVNNIILKTLVNGDKYGYEIIKEVENFSEGKFVLKQPSLYSSLSRFEEKGYVSSYWGDSDIGGRRHYYHLTEKGLNYFNNEILKSKILRNSNQQYETNIQNNLDSSDNSIKTNNTNIVEITETVDIPAVIGFDKKENNEVIVDHDFHLTTPIEKSIDNNSIILNNDNFIDRKIIWKEIANQVKINNKRCMSTSLKKLHYIKPKKQQKVILDSDGIYKLRDIDYVPNFNQSNKSKIIDNVGKRITNQNFGYNSYSSTTNNNQISNNNFEISDEERKRRNENFLAKFNSLTKSRLKPTKNDISKSNEYPTEKEIDYRSKLNKLFDAQDNAISENTQLQYNQSNDENNLFNYVEEEEINKTDDKHDLKSDILEEDDDKFINLEPEEFSIKSDNSKYIEEISNYSNNEQNIKINRYENRSNAVLSDKSYVLINKIKCFFGFILLMLFIVEITASYFIFKNLNLIVNNDKYLFIVAYVLAVFISLIFILPIIFNPDEHKINNFKLKYASIFGILTFLVSLILIYCINTLLGFEIDNFNYFAIKLILPIILTFNFIVGPPIYSLLLKIKKFYD